MPYPPQGLPTGAKITSGTYTADSSENKAIAHGLGVTPQMVLISPRAGYGNYFHRIFGGQGSIYAVGATNGYQGVTAPDATNFYVGNSSEYTISANLTGRTYYWVAIG